MAENENITKEPTIEDLESDTKQIMDKQITEITSSIEDIAKTINLKLDKLRLGVLQKTINKVVKSAFDERINEITKDMKTGFSLELRKVILEKFFASELGNLKEKITADMTSNEYNDADVKWAKAKAMLAQFQDYEVKMQWRIFENEYLAKKKVFQTDQREINRWLKKYREEIKNHVSREDYQSAEANWVEIKELLERTIDTQMKEEWEQIEAIYVLQKKGFDALTKSIELNGKYAFNESIDLVARTINILQETGLDELVEDLNDRVKLTIKLQEEHKNALHKLIEYESKYDENYAKDYLNASLDFCIKIVELAEFVGDREKIELYIKRSEQIEKRIAYQKKYTEQEALELLQKAQSIGKFMGVEDGVLPLIDDFAIGDMVVNPQDLLKEHRVSIKNELDTSVILKSESGEVFEEQISKEIQRSEDDDQLDVLYSVQTGIVNPFDDSIEEALLKDLIPYNFEIMNVHVNGKLVEELPEKRLTKDGMVLAWEFEDIPTKEEVQIVYDLRRRVSRTILFYLKNELRVIKTHSKLSHSEKEGVYQVAMPFTNSHDDKIQGVIVEDIIPLYYVYFVKQPMELRPTEIIPSRNGDMIKWDVGTMEVGTRDYQYKLLELYRYEELKIKMTSLSSSLMESLHNGDLNDVTRKNTEIDNALNLLSS